MKNKIMLMRTNVFNKLAAFALVNALLVTAALGALPTLSVNFEGIVDAGVGAPTLLDPTDVAGVVPLANWNNIFGNNIHDLVLNDSNGTPTAVTIFFDADESWGSGTGTADGDHKMLNGYLGISNDGHYRPLFLHNVPDGAYKLLLYNVQDGRQDNAYTINGDNVHTLHITHEGAGDFNASPVYRRGTSTNPAARDVCNYVQFDQVGPVNGTITIDCRSESFRGILNGIQLVALDPAAFRFLNEPQDVTLDSGGSASFVSTVIDGTGAVTYQWYTNGVADTSAAGQTNIYSRTGIVENENGRTFQVVATDSTALSITSRLAVLTVTPLHFTSEPADQTVVAGQNVTFSASVTSGTPGYTYQWYTNGVADPSGTGTSYTKNGAVAVDNGRTFQIVVTDTASISVTSRVATLTVVNGAGKLAISFEGRGDCAPGCATLSGPTVAGVVPQGNWNNVDNSSIFSGVSSPMTDGDGTPTTVTLAYGANDAWNNDGASGSGNEKLYKGIAKANGTNRRIWFTFNNLPSRLYDVYVYLNVNGDGRIGDLDCNGAGTNYYTSQHSYGGSFIQSVNTNPSTRDTGNYIKFTGIAPDALNQIHLSLINRGDPDGTGVAGFQLVPTTATTLVSAASHGNPNGLLAFFGAAMGTTALDPANYTLTGSTPTAALASSDEIIGVAATPGSASSSVSVVGTTAGANNYPGTEVPANSIDGNTGTKYLNFAKVNVGTIVRRAAGAATVTGFRFSTGGDAPERDPLLVSIEGTTAPDANTAAGSATWTSLYNGLSGLAPDPGRSVSGRLIRFTNAAPFDTYRILVTGLRNTTAANSVQYSELQLYTDTPTAPLTVSGAAYATTGSNVIRLTTSPLVLGNSYTLTVNNVQDQQGTLISPNPASAKFVHGSEFQGPYGLRMQRFDGDGDFIFIQGKIANCVTPDRDDANIANVSYGTNPNFNNNALDGNTENYGTKIFGEFIAPTTGNYRFALKSDDNSALYLSTDSSADNKVLLTAETGCCGQFTGHMSSFIPLVASRRYYFEVLHQEGGGGDHVEVVVQKPGDAAITDAQVNYIPRSMFATNYSLGCPARTFFSTFGNVFLTRNISDQTVGELSTTTFAVAADGTPSPEGGYAVQWYSNNVAIPGAVRSIYSFQPLRDANGSHYYAIVQNGFSSATSAVATLTVTVDNTPPTLLSAVGGVLRNNASAIFSEALKSPGAVNINNYRITNAAGADLAISSAIISPNGKVVTLTTATQTPNTQYWIVVSNVTDLAGIPNVITPNPSVASFVAPDLDVLPGKILFRAYNAGGNSVAVDSMVNDPLYPNFPDFTQLINGLTSRLASDPAHPGYYSGDTRENYGATLVGHFIPPVSGDWIFYTHADDGSRLFMNTNGPDSSGKVMLLNVIPCCGAFTANPTVPLSLVAGQAYYIEGLYKEGGGGDYMEIAARMVGDNSTLVFVPGSQVALASKLSISQQPTNITVVQNHNATFSLTATLAGAGAGSQTYQWQRSIDTAGTDFTNIPSATSSNFTIFATLADDQFQFRAVVTSFLATNTSTAATLTVLSDTNGPVLVSAFVSPYRDSIILTWNEIVLAGNASGPDNYYLALDPLNFSTQLFFDTATPSVVGDHSVVVLHLDQNQNPTMLPDTTYSLEIGSQFDLVGNPTAPSGINQQIDPDHGVVTNLHTFAFGGQVIGMIFREIYDGIGGTAIVDLTNNPAYLANNPTSFDMLSSFDTGGDRADNYGARVSGYIIPSETANYTFQFISDDAGYVDLSSDENRANATRLASETPGCCANILSGTRTLQAGHAYFVEGVYKEGGGGDYLRLYWKNNASIPNFTIIPGANLAYFYSMAITQQPANVTVDPNTNGATATFTVGAVAGGAARAFRYQWERSDDGGATFTPIPGATSASYTRLVRFGDNNAQFHCIVTLLGNFQSITSNAATLTLIPDTTGPTVLRVNGFRAGTNVNVLFSEPLDPASAANPANYTITSSLGGSVTVNGAVLSGDGLSVVLQTADLGFGSNYTVHVAGVADFGYLNPVAPTNVAFQTWTVGLGSLLFDIYNGMDASQTLVTFTNNPVFPDSPSISVHIAGADSRLFYPDNVHEGYGARISGYVVPPITGNYAFYVSADDDAELSLSTDSSPTNRSVIVFSPSCCQPFSAHSNAAPVSLMAGQPYYMQLLYKEGTGGDYGQVAAKLAADPTNPDTLSPIPGIYLSSLADPVGASITITQQPANTSFVLSSGSGNNLIAADFNANNGGFTVTTPLAYAGAWAYNAGNGTWHEDGQDADNGQANISMLNSPTLTVTAAGHLVLALSHRYSFEFDGTPWDGGQILISVNGGAFTPVPQNAFTQNGYTGNAVAIGGPSFTSQSPNYGTAYILTIADLGNFNPSDTVRVQFLAGSDSNTRGAVPNWEIDSVQISQANPAQNVTLSVGASAVNVESTNPPQVYQWSRNNGSGFVPILGANSRTYTFIPQSADNGALFRATIYIPGANTNSASALLTVSQPAMVHAVKQLNGQMVISWSGSFCLQETTELAGPSTVWVTSSVVNGVPFTPGAGNKFYRLADTCP